MNDRPTQIIDTPFGQMRAVFNRADQISFRDLTDLVWCPVQKAHVAGEPITVNRVKYRASFTFEQKDGKWEGTYRSLDRVGSTSMYDYSQAALRKVTETLAQIVAELAETQADAFRAAQIASLTDEYDQTNRRCQKLADELSEERAELARLREELSDAQAEAGIHDSEQMQFRYLTPAELGKIAAQVSTPEFAKYLTEYDHAPGNGLCLKVALSVGQARELDPIADDMLSGQLTRL
jgi:hypothetical protein